ncbi:hypothetical protein EV702DRAFT_1257223 [Suillus placidus]|uniref:Uncharacterized protein n=1 Tax=Suillus placidus TaxID=48579 RepID=A0A9P6ZID0_9AGAM|nr:hypothetical protein EV702DRAFT_1257223 [Suillus placidus]
MSLKFKATVSRLTTNFLRRLGMSELEPPESLPYLNFGRRLTFQSIPVDLYKDHLVRYISDRDEENTYMKCLLLRVEHYKCSQNVKHEFLVLYFTHWNSSSDTAVICADRSVEAAAAESSGLLTPSSSENVAQDLVTVIGGAMATDTTQYLRFKFKSFKRISSLSFSSDRPSALQVSILLDLVNKQDTNYHIFRAQCYWFCDVVCRSLERLFQGVEELHGPHTRGHLGLIPVVRTSEGDVDDVCNGYPIALQKAMVQVNQLQIQRAATRAQIWEEGGASAQLKINEQQCQIAERDRQLEERDRQLEEMRAEIERMRAQFSASKDKQ